MLYLIGTPIGNLDDLSIRACKTLLSVDIILAEDTRAAHTLLERARSVITNIQASNSNKDEINLHSWDLELRTLDSTSHNSRVVSYYQEVEFEKLPEVIEWLKEGKDVALISQAGMPVISDPGHLLVQTARKYDIPVTVIPGPSSVDTALVASGMKFDHFYFVGFLPKKENEKTTLFARLFQVSKLMHKDDIVFVAFESPERIADTLTQLYTEQPTIHTSLCRELTKKFEEVITKPQAKPYKGEIVLLFSFS